MNRRLSIALGLLLSITARASVVQGDIEWGAQRYSRNGVTNSAKGIGNAWVRRGDRTVRADEIEMDFGTNRAVANGNVHIIEPGRDIWCSHLDYNLHGEDALIENMKMVSGSVVITGAVAHKIDNRHFEVEDGTYSNCNVDLSKDPTITECPLDWKLQGRKFTVAMGEYAHFYDVLLYAKSLPVLYTPYLVIPVKTTRQSGLLMPSFPYAANTGNGASIPLFLALGDWHDLTLTPTPYFKTNNNLLHLESLYRYIYSPTTYGTLDLFLLSSTFLPVYRAQDNTVLLDTKQDNSRKALGVIGEGAINLDNHIDFGGRVQSRQILRMMSSPIYNFEFPSDLYGDLGYLRSMVNLTVPGDEWLATARVQHYQSLVIPENPFYPKDPTLQQTPYLTSDQGAVSELPSLTLARTNSPLLGNFLTYEGDAEFNNFYRRQPTDPLPLQPGAGANEQSYFLRTGRRLQLEPRLVASIPLPYGMQLQPVLRAGALAYQFDYPQSRVVNRQYASLEVPFSFYLSKVFNTSMDGYQKISHVFQPRVIFGSSLYNSPEPSGDPFFLRSSDTDSRYPYLHLPNNAGNPQPVSAPRFDYNDQISEYQYLRFELINRLRRWGPTGNERFFLLQLSEQYNLRTNDFNPLYKNQLGPIELIAEIKIWRFYFQAQALYQLAQGVAQAPGVEAHTGPPGINCQLPPDQQGNTDYLANPCTHEYDISSTLTYEAPNSDRLSLTSLFSNRVDTTQVQQTVMLTALKRLPTFFDIDASAEYSLRQGRLVSYTLGFTFQAKPRSCWYLSTHFGTSGSNNQPFFNLGFSLLFGTVQDMHT